ncbi:MAG: ankyrin repeat domain-containing protein [Bryobacterales bacterium]|nr:ankyrin repeat domain-containing protein [Bryobacterales bacterium]
MANTTAILATLSVWSLSAAQVPAMVDFGRDIQPLFREHCVECHGPSQQMMGLRLDRRRDALPNRVGANGARIVPGDSARSVLYRRLTGTQSGPQMPPAGALPEPKIKLIQAWIDQGAVWPDELSGDRSRTPPDAAVERIRSALREGDAAEFRRLVRANPTAVNGKGEDGWTPLMYAALYGDAETIRLLVDRGAMVNEKNDAGGTALIYAVDDLEKTKLLLERGADPNLRTGEGRTALLVAVSMAGSYPVVKLLLEKSSDAKLSLPNGRGALSLAIASQDPRVLQLLLERGAPRPLPLSSAIARGCKECFERMLPYAQPADLRAALDGATIAGDLRLIDRLLERGAQATPSILQAAALSQTAIPAATIRTFLSRGANPSLKTSFGLTTLDFAKRQGKDGLVKVLMEAGIREESPAPVRPRPKPAASIRVAVERAIPLLQRSDAVFLERAGCVSCHNNSLTAMTVAEARSRGFRVNEEIASSQLMKIAAFLKANGERGLENEGIPGGIDTVSYILLGMAAEKYPGDVITEVWARYSKNRQAPDGRFKCESVRPPLETSDFQVTAATIRSLLAYAPKSHQADYRRAVKRATRWLESAAPASTEDHVFRILGLIWGGGSRETIRKTGSQLLALQRSDGGWGQIPALASDAYATGQALVALREAGIMSPSDTRYQRGVRYLVDSQMEDGSWLVRTRSPSFQPYFDSGFPHGYDQFISAAASNWAVMALLPAAATDAGR